MLGLAFAIASCNIRHQQNYWAGEDLDHPLLIHDDHDDGWSSAAA